MPIKLYNQLICLVKGHTRTRKTVETDMAIHKFSCSRCGCPLDMGFYKNMPEPPGADKNKWEAYKKMAIENYLKR